MLNKTEPENKIVQLAQEFIRGVKTGGAADGFIKPLCALKLETLKENLNNDALKNAFWINLYNGFTQMLLKKNPELYQSRTRFFTQKSLCIAGIHMSLDDIEHGILRRSKLKWSLGYLNNMFAPAWEKGLRVAQLDCRIHFALNCGARSCPPILFYRAEKIEQQLDTATTAYLESEVDYEEQKNSVRLPAILSWFRADFGGKPGMITLLKKHNIIPQNSQPKIIFKPYDWTLTLNHYQNEIS
jgi:hypothetical protein